MWMFHDEWDFDIPNAGTTKLVLEQFGIYQETTQGSIQMQELTNLYMNEEN